MDCREGHNFISILKRKFSAKFLLITPGKFHGISTNLKMGQQICKHEIVLEHDQTVAMVTKIYSDLDRSVYLCVVTLLGFPGIDLSSAIYYSLES